jgi:hypothetical protein
MLSIQIFNIQITANAIGQGLSKVKGGGFGF